MKPSLQLQHIKVDVCPECGSKAVRWSQGDLHTCGDWNESVEFWCGGTLRYSPNFRRIGDLEGCTVRRHRLAVENHTRDAAVLETVDWARCEPEVVAAVMRVFNEIKFHHRVVAKREKTS